MTHRLLAPDGCCQQVEHPASRPKPSSGKPISQPLRLEQRRYGARSSCWPSAAASGWRNRSTQPWHRQRHRLPPRLASPSARSRCLRWSPRAGPTGRSARGCLSLPRPPASTSQGSWPSSGSPAAARRPQSPTASASTGNNPRTLVRSPPAPVRRIRYRRAAPAVRPRSSTWPASPCYTRSDVV